MPFCAASPLLHGIPHRDGLCRSRRHAHMSSATTAPSSPSHRASTRALPRSGQPSAQRERCVANSLCRLVFSTEYRRWTWSGVRPLAQRILLQFGSSNGHNSIPFLLVMQQRHFFLRVFQLTRCMRSIETDCSPHHPDQESCPILRLS